ncbi:acylphosphatase [Parapedobacter indicus]|uniref:acylphosphatase n=1 Tax=Parapedobacter indicus TaxID=1477437 RepID=A0A1I3KLF3_9SPHI|nr:acylphosphatase [Parapedobacter indicus]PPL01858.1 acylphosphatase [Parapedobacter indicus]SFI73333.1 acylphosphatase [Parapedobacter indicus]
MAKQQQRRHLNITVSGKVQGVYFRLTTKAVADQLGIKGMALNKSDGTVYIEAEGDSFALEAFLEWCHEGPENAVVENVASVEGDMKNYRNFEVIRKSRTSS